MYPDMDKIPEISEIQQSFGKAIYNIAVKSNTRITITVNPGKITEMAGFLFKRLKFRFIIASALETDEGIEILYHFSLDASGLVINIRVVLDKKNPVIDSLTVLFEAANWIEREMHELFGINFLNHPNLKKLISNGNWAEGVYPYRKSEQKK